VSDRADLQTDGKLGDRTMFQGEPDLAIEITGLAKTYAGSKNQPPKEALKGIDLAIRRGSIFGLLGPNGAGKSTLINILAGLVVKSAGQARIWGFDIEVNPRRARRSIGVVPQELNLDAFFTPRETLDIQAGLYGVPRSKRRVMEVLDVIGLADKADAYARSLSGGMRRRLLVGKALIHQPPVVILDEPTAGVDVDLRRSLWSHMRTLNERGVTVVLTTHYLEEAEAMCDEIAIIDKGRLVACGETRDLIQKLDQKTLHITTVEPIASSPNDLPDDLKALGAVLVDAHHLEFQYRPSQVQVGELLDRISALDIRIRDLATAEADLEELFLRLTSPQDEAA